ncbi:hypothetical protein EX895_002247 [Sporisorium graminicola]|uniref:DUF829 domain-containing protein n=1 Tax=Sporisorium graminicola TaxID=280036 RepID=A0A4U7KXG7_9BASI|nr:hypothetical protein EX895_002247 [Sporisorium graminicola]TKY89006.1 hypothetical protein EX895_002247 [Sporisorium graminicola]
MPPSKSSKTSKASKAAKAILHPKSTLATARANHSRQASSESLQSSEAAATPSKSPASSIRRAPSSASIASNTAKPLPSAPSSTGSPAVSVAALPVAAPAPSVPAPSISTDILSLTKQAPATSSTTAKAEPREPSTAAAPYAIDDSPEKVSTAPQVEPIEIVTDTRHAGASKDNETFAAEVAAVLAESEPVPDEKPLAEAVAAPTLVTDAIVNKPTEAAQDASSSLQSAPGAPAARPVTTTATFTPPELTRMQHNTFVSRPSDPSRAALRDLDPSALPAPLRPLDQQKGLARSPSHVVIFGWMDAPIRLVAKYAQPYTVLFPDATVVIQLSDGKTYRAREAVRRQQLQRVIAELSSSPAGDTGDALITMDSTKDVGDSTVTLIEHSEARSASSEDGKAQTPEVGGFVIHSFSDGGAGNLALFLDELVRRKGASPRVHSLIMDSSPGKANPSTGSFAFTLHLANRPRLRAIVRFFVYIGLYLMGLWTKVTGQPGRGELMRKRLNSLRSWSWVTASYTPKAQQQQQQQQQQQVQQSEKTDYPPRMYVYTKADKLIPWQYVEEHANHLASLRSTRPHLVEMERQADREALLSSVKAAERQIGAAEYKVELRRWDTPAHCSIGRSDFEGYWAAVMDFHTNVLSTRD